MSKPLIPEPKYFLNKKNPVNYNFYFNSLFSHKNKNELFGEKSTTYLEKISIAKRIKKIISNFKIIKILRNPIDRAFSHYNFSKKFGFETLQFEEAIKLEKKRKVYWQDLVKKEISVNPYSYIERGKYYKYVCNWEKIVGRKNMIFVISENLFENVCMIQKIFNELGVKKNFVPRRLKFKSNNINKDNITPITDKLRKNLSKEFIKPNQLLMEKYKLDLSKWD